MVLGPLNRSGGLTQSNAVLVKMEPGWRKRELGRDMEYIPQFFSPPVLSGILAVFPLTE